MLTMTMSNDRENMLLCDCSNRGGYRGRGRGRGGFGRDRAPGDADRFGKREFERHSGSDKTYVSCMA